MPIAATRIHPPAQTELSPFGLRIDLGEGATLGELSRDDVLSRALEHKVVLIRGLAPQTATELLRFCARDVDRELLHWDSGPVMEMKVQADPQNYLFSSEPVPFHWDGAFHIVPGYLVFSCIEAPDPDAGGETLFCNTEAVWNDAPEATKELWKGLSVSYETEKKAHYGGTIQVRLVDEHPRSGATVLRYGEPVETRLNPVTVQFETCSPRRQAELIDELREVLYRPQYCYAHRWCPGDLLIADNHALLHGRNRFTASSRRHLRRLQIL